MLSNTREEYILQDYQWPNWKTSITYSFVTHIFDYSDFNRELDLGRAIPAGDRTRDLIRDAMDYWEAVCGVNFVEVRDSPSANVRIAWMPSWESDGRGGTLGITNTWFTSREIIREQTVTFDWADSGSDVRIFDTALHEFGHVLGIDHSNVRDVVLSGPPYTRYHDQPGYDLLQPDDIAAARALWGPPVATAGPDLMIGGAGNDRFYGGAGNDTLAGVDGNDWLSGGTGNDLLAGRAGNDILIGGAGNDSMYGYSSYEESVYDGNDRLWGQSGDDRIDGGAGNDSIYGGTGNDTIDGGDGADIILSGEGDDTTAGGDGNDGIWAEGGNDTLDGGAGADFLAGGTGNDSLNGGDDADYITGESGNDTIDGGAGYDILAGGAGDDSLIGGAEGDTFFGQEGADTFVISGGLNWIMDFDSSERLSIEMNLAQVQAASTQQGSHLHIDLAGGGDLYLASSTVADIEADNLIV